MAQVNLRDRFEDVQNEIYLLREEAAQAVDPDSYILSTFDNIQDWLTSLEVYLEDASVPAPRYTAGRPRKIAELFTGGF
jgi:hypothetical protein